MSVDAAGEISVETGSYSAHRPVIAATRHVVSAGHYLAAEAGFHVLEAGGNAVDAGVAAALVLGVVHSDQVNIAGVAPMIIFMAETEELVVIDGLGRWPAAANCETFLRDHGGEIPHGLLRTVIPAAPYAHLTALERYGRMSFGEVASFATRFARDGFVMYPFLNTQLKMVEARNRRWPSNAAIYLPNDRTPDVGEIFVQADLGRSLQYMADEEAAVVARGGDRKAGLHAARDAFYRGDIMRKITCFHAENGGWLTERDMADYSVRLERTQMARFGALEVHSCGFWCQGPALPQAMGILRGFDLAAMEHNSVPYIHHVAEALKLTFADREAHYGDPDFLDVPAETLLSEAYAAKRRAMINAGRAWPEMPPAGVIRPNQDALATPTPTRGEAAIPPLDTSYACAVDRWGNAISVTPSDVSSDTIVIPGTGLAPSSRGSQSRADPNHPAGLAPGKRPRLTPNPAMAMQRGKRVMPLGTPGGDSQVQAMVQVLLNIVVFGMDPQTAIEQPRFISYSHPDSFAPHPYYPGRLCLEGRIPTEVGEGLAALGHDVRRWPDWLWRAGGVCLIDSDTDKGIHLAGADPRRAAAYAMGW